MSEFKEKRDFMRRKVKHIHFVGIGGIGMSGIAEVLLTLGYQVSGSDISESDMTVRLASLGAAVYKGHGVSNLNRADVVVVSSAIDHDNPEVAEAHRRGVPVIPRAEMLAELLKMKFSIAVSGCHGKTTTTSMIAAILASGGLDPTVVVGGKLASVGRNAQLGSGEVIVAEADESDGSFLKLAPSIAVITNIDREHMDYYHDIEDIKSSFLQFANSVPFYGTTIICSDDGHVQDIMPLIKRKIVSYGLSEGAEYRATDITFQGMNSRFSLHHGGHRLGEITLQAPGRFNVCNATAAVAVARELDMDFQAIQKGIESFQGVQRRLEVKGLVNGITVVDDYGHHPTEIRETLAAARSVWNSRVIVVFQPHRYTRTKALFDDFLVSFNNADEVIITDIYAASEREIEGVHSRFLCERMRECGHGGVKYMAEFEDIVRYLQESLHPGDVVMTLGAGNVWKIGEQFLGR